MSEDDADTTNTATPFPAIIFAPSPIEDAEQVLQDEMARRIERAARELHDAIYIMRLVACRSANGRSPFDRCQWRWRYDDVSKRAIRYAKHAIDSGNDIRF